MKILDIIANKLLVPAYAAFKRDYSLKYTSEIELFNSQALEEIKTFQLRRIREIAKHAYDTTEYYRCIFDKIGLKHPQLLTWEDYSKIPVLTKDIIKLEGHNLVSKTWKLEDLRKTATGGTTSSPTPFYSDWESTYRKWSATSVFDGWLGSKPGMKVAYLWGASQDFIGTKTFKQKLLSLLIRRCMYLPGSPLDDDIMENYYQKLRRFKPFLLQSYPTPLDIFSDFLKRKSYSLTIPAISCTAEPLLEQQKNTIIETFGQTPCNWYGAREAGRIATECQHHDGMHINAYCLRLDVKSSDYVEDGLGAVVLTDLWNLGMPLIRYEIGDVGCITEEQCPCGSHLPRLKEILGRVTDTFVNSRGQKIPGVGLTNRYIKDSLEIKSMQIIQHGINNFEILIVPAEEFTSTTKVWLQQKLDEFMLEPTGMRVTVVDQIPREKSGKVRFCKNLMQ